MASTTSRTPLAAPPDPAPNRLDLRVDLLSGRVHELLLTDIVLGRYAPGERLNLDAIASEFGISRSPVREAVRQLSDEGFISVARNARTEVAEWSGADMRERVRLIGVLVGDIVEQAGAERAAAALHPVCDSRAGDGTCAHRDPADRLARFLDACGALLALARPAAEGVLRRGLLVPLQVYLSRDALAARGDDARVRAVAVD